jgi:hypothetical protein
MNAQPSPTVDIVMLGSFGVWTRGTIQSRALPLARDVARRAGIRTAIVTTPWDDPSQAGKSQKIDDVLIINTQSHQLRHAARAIVEQACIARGLEPHLIHVLKPKAAAGATAELLRRGRLRPAMIVDCDDWEGDGGWNEHAAYPLPLRRLFNVQETRLIRMADGVTAASTLLEERARRLRMGSAEPQVAYLPNGLEAVWRERLSTRTDSERPRSQNSFVLYSRFAEFSSGWLSALITAIDRLATAPVRMDIIGPITEGEMRFERLNWLNVELHGYVERDALPSLLGRSAVALYPYDDNLINRSKQSVKLLELMAAGCAIISSDVGEIQRIGAGSIVTVEPHNVAAFASAAVALIENPAHARELGEAARRRAAVFDISVLGHRLAMFYRHFGVG